MQVPFIGGMAEDRSLPLNAQKSVNCFPVIRNKEAKDQIALYGTPGLKFYSQATMYGSGTDGTVIISTNTTLTRDMQYDTLTVNAGITLNTSGFTVMCSVLLTNNGIITDNDSGGVGGAGGIGADDEGAVGGDPRKFGGGYGGDGGSGVGTAYVGGVGGNGGGVVRIYAKTLTNNGVIHANGTDATAPSEYGGGANGGDGGIVSLFYDARTVGTVTVTGGAHSNGISYEVDSYTKLLLHMDGSNGENTFTDEGGHAVSTSGNVNTDTSRKKFGTASAVFDGANDWISIEDSTDWYFAANPFTVDFWMYVSTMGSYYLCGQFVDVNNYWSLSMQNFSSGITYSTAWLNFTMFATGTVRARVTTTSRHITKDTWHHIELVRNGTNVYIFIDGVAVPLTVSTSISTNPVPNFVSPFYIGSYAHPTGFAGWIDEFCISKGVARHTSSFTVPTAPYFQAVDGSDGNAGTATWTNVPYTAFSTAELRGGIVYGSKFYLVVGANVMIVNSTGVSTCIGSITTTTGNVFMACNGTQILIVDGTAYGHYITISSDTLNDITDADFPISTSCTFIDGYFVVAKKDTGRFHISGLYNAAAWDALEYEVAAGDPDNITRVFSANGNLWIFGDKTAEVWYNNGGTDFPFQKINGALIEDGLAAAAAICLIKDQFYFLSNHKEVLRTVGYQREKISTTYLDKELQSYDTVSDARAYEYRADGHIFFVLTFPTEDKTWVYDITTDYWHEWQSYKTVGVATYGRHRGSIGFHFEGKYIIGDYSNGKLYELDLGTYTDDGELIPRTRRGQVINKERLRVAHHSVELDFEVGVGIPGSGSGSAPIVGLRWSDDGTNTWSQIYYRELGVQAAWNTRVFWKRLGMSRNRVYEITYKEPTKFVLISAFADIQQESK